VDATESDPEDLLPGHFAEDYQKAHSGDTDPILPFDSVDALCHFRTVEATALEARRGKP